MNALTIEQVRSIETIVDRAIASGRPEAAVGFVVIPDVVEVEAVANGLTIPLTWRVRRPDGRSALIFTDPKVVEQ